MRDSARSFLTQTVLGPAGRLVATVAAIAVLSACCQATAQAAAPKAPEGDRNTSDTIVMTNRVVDMNGGINTSMIQRAQKKFFEYDAQSHDPIWLVINSPGGSVEAGLVLIDTFEALKSPVYCLVESKAYSMAAITLVFCDEKYALKHATVMLHEASYGTVGEDPQIRSRLDFITKYLDRVHHEIAKRLGMKHDEYRKKIRDAWWMLADEAAKVKLIDGVVQRIIYKELPVKRIETKRTTTVSTEVPEVPPSVDGDQIPKRRD